MRDYNIRLVSWPYDNEGSTYQLHPDDENEKSIDGILRESDQIDGVYSDLSYKIIVGGEDINDIENVKVYINDYAVNCNYSNGIITFQNEGNGTGKIFLDCYGFLEICICIISNKHEPLFLKTDYIPVYVRNESFSKSVKSMIDYIYENSEELLYNGEPKPKGLSNIKENSKKSMESQLLLAEDIVKIYEKQYPYFKANCRGIIKKKSVTDHFEKMDTITPITLQYMACHPEELKEINGVRGIRISNRMYQPERTLMLQNEVSKDTYENRIIVGFIHSLMDSISGYIDNVETCISKMSINEEFVGEYIFSPWIFFTETKRIFTRYLIRLKQINKKLNSLWTLYKNIMPVTYKSVVNTPKPSAIFMSIPQYNIIYTRINQWFKFGIYDFTDEKFMMSFIKISELYESYVLSKLINHFKESGMDAAVARKCKYPVQARWKYKNVNFNNTFVFEDTNRTVTLFYQPVLYDSDKSQVNGIGLYRNNTVSLNYDDETERSGHYYVPDFVIKISTEDRIKYIILDAKFSNIKTVKNHYIAQLAYKYLFSVSPIHNYEEISGLCIIYGKCDEDNELQTFYNKQLINNRISPFAELLPMMEGINSEHSIEINTVLNKCV